MSRPRVVCLVGPTASGKTALALELAERFDAEVVSADSRQVYRGLDIGTAKPSRAERARVPHHLIDVVDPEDQFDVVRFRTLARSAIDRAHARHRPVLIVGGTGLWVRVLLRGVCPAPPGVPTLRGALEAWAVREGPGALHRRLALVDPVAAARIHPHDTLRVVRALEVALVSGRRLSAWQADHAFQDAPWDALVIGLVRPAAELAQRIERRAQGMLESGLLEEVAALARRGLPPAAPVWSTLGYRELRACAEGTADCRSGIESMVRATWRFARRQLAWFRADPTICWRHPEKDGSQIVAEVERFLAAGEQPHDVRVAKPQAAG